jgi:hypothetical protein
MLEDADIQWFASQVLAVGSGNLEDVFEAFWHGWTTNFAGGTVGSNQLKFLSPGARGEDHGRTDATEAFDVRGIAWDFGAGQNRHGLG